MQRGAADPPARADLAKQRTSFPLGYRLPVLERAQRTGFGVAATTGGAAGLTAGFAGTGLAGTGLLVTGLASTFLAATTLATGAAFLAWAAIWAKPAASRTSVC